MRIGKLYVLSLLVGYLSFLICGIIQMHLNNGTENLLPKGFLLLIFGGVLYIPIFAISNLTQFLLIKNPNRKRLAFFSSILIIGIICLIGIKMDMMDEFLWKVFLPAQLIVSLIAYYYFQKQVKPNSY